MRLVDVNSAALIGAALIAFAAPLAAQSTSTPMLLVGESVARVRASGTVERRPDKLVIATSVFTDAPTAVAARAGNSKKLVRLVNVLGVFGIASGEIKTEELFARALHPEINGNEDESKIIGYQSRQRVIFELRDFSRIEALFDQLAALGVSDTSTASFALSDSLGAQREAQRSALAQARAEADNIAGAVGKRVSRLLLVANNEESYRGDAGSSNFAIVTGARARRLMIDPAPIKIESHVFVDWSLVDR